MVAHFLQVCDNYLVVEQVALDSLDHMAVAMYTKQMDEVLEEDSALEVADTVDSLEQLEI